MTENTSENSSKGVHGGSKNMVGRALGEERVALVWPWAGLENADGLSASERFEGLRDKGRREGEKGKESGVVEQYRRGFQIEERASSTCACRRRGKRMNRFREGE